MRTWTLSEKGLDVRVKPENEPSMADERLIPVIESEPVLDLLEDVLMPTMHMLAQGNGLTDAEKEVAELFRAHGRLDG